jgi:2Fe-2S ferredoxin
MKHREGEEHPTPTVPLRIIMQDPKSLTGKDDKEINLIAAKGESILETALEAGINIEHACGGVAACSTCHIYVKQGDDSLKEPDDNELDRVEEAPGLQRNSRLSCQCIIEGDGPIVVEVPAWNRNAVKEVPH